MVRQIVRRQVLSRQALSRQASARQTMRGLQSREATRPLTLSEKKSFIAEQLNLGSPDNFDFSFFSDGTVSNIKGKPVSFVSVKNKRTGQRSMGSFIPAEFIFGPSGQLLKQIERGTFKSEVNSRFQRRRVFIKREIDFARGTERRFGLRSLRGGRQSPRLVFTAEKGRIRETQLIPKVSKKQELAERTQAEREFLREFGFLGVRSAKFRREQQRKSEQQRRKTKIFEAQARLKLQKLIESGKITPSKSGKVGITVGGQRFNFVVETKARPSVKSAQTKAEKRALQVVQQLDLIPGQKFKIQQDGYEFTFSAGSRPKSIRRDPGVALSSISADTKLSLGEKFEPIKDIKSIQDVFDRLDTARQEQLIRKVTGPPEQRLRAVVTLGLIGGIRGFGGAVQTVVNPIETAKGFVEAVRPKNFVSTVKGEIQAFQTDPVGMVAEYWTFGRVFGIAGRFAKKSQVGRYISDEFYIRTQAKKVSEGTGIPKKKVESILRATLKGPKAQEAINPFGIKGIKPTFLNVKSLTRTEAVALKKALPQIDHAVFGSSASFILSKGKTKTPVDLDIGVKSSAEFNRVFLKELPKNVRTNYIISRGKVFRGIPSLAQATSKARVIRVGSRLFERLFDVKSLERLIPDKSILTRRGSLPVSKLVKRVKGVEQFKTLTSLAEKILKERAKLLISPKTVKGRRANAKRLRSITKLRKRLRRERKKFKISELPKLVNRSIISALEVPTQKLVKVEGITLVGFGEQTTRKALGTLQVLIEKNVRRAKDPQGLVSGLQVQLDALRKAKPKSLLRRLRNRRRIKTLENALKVLTSKDFARLLEAKIPGITKDFPILRRVNVKKLKKSKKLSVKRLKKFIKTQLKKKVKKRKPSRPKRIPSKLPKRKVKVRPARKVEKKKKKVKKRKPSRLPKKRRPSRVPSRVPKKRKPSRVPSRLKRKRPSKVPARKPSKVPSRVPRRKPSRVPARKPSKVPARKPSKVVSKVPARKPSKLPSRRPSRLRKRKPSRLPVRARKRPVKELRRREVDRLIKRSLDEAKKNRTFIFLSDLESIIAGRKAKKSERAKLLAKGRIFSGLEVRPLV